VCGAGFMGRVILDDYLVKKTRSRVYIDHYVVGVRHEEAGGKRGVGTNRDKDEGHN